MSEKRNKEDFIKESRPKNINNRYTYGDYLSWDDERRYELIDGVVYNMTPAPARRHQEILGAINYQIYNFLLDKKCQIYFAPFDVRLPNKGEDNKNISTVVQPDLLVVCDLDKLDEKGCKGAPDLIVEIVSPYSGGRDRKIKRDLYEKHAVKEYWIVDYNEKTVEVYLLNNKKEYGKPDIYTDEDMLPVNIFDDLKVDLKPVFSKRK